MRLLKKKPHESNLPKIRMSKCRGNLKSRKGRKVRLKMYLIEQNSCNLLPQIEKKTKNKCGRWKVQNRRK